MKSLTTTKTTKPLPSSYSCYFPPEHQELLLPKGWQVRTQRGNTGTLLGSALSHHPRVREQARPGDGSQESRRPGKSIVRRKSLWLWVQTSMSMARHMHGSSRNCSSSGDKTLGHEIESRSQEGHSPDCSLPTQLSEGLFPRSPPGGAWP